jgi:hypothetical protein
MAWQGFAPFGPHYPLESLPTIKGRMLTSDMLSYSSFSSWLPMALACLTDHVSVDDKKNFNAFLLSLKMGNQCNSLSDVPLQNSIGEQRGCQRHGIAQALVCKTPGSY